MLTPRGWWFLVCVLFLLVFARLGVTVYSLGPPRLAPRPNDTLGVLGVAAGLWFGWEWLLFAVRARFVAGRIRLVREIRDGGRAVDTLWAGRAFEVRAAVWLPPGLGIPWVRLNDRKPYRAEWLAGENRYEGPVTPGQGVRVTYSLRCPEIGRVRFEGVRVRLSDYHGFFYAEHFARDGAEYRVLPPLADSAGHAPSVKRHNLLPPPGVHRLRRPGSGSELLDLRDYLPGDPPKTIAWKASARRDRLITKEFESEVPLRCTLFVDVSNGVRAGRPGMTALNKLVEIAASVAQAAAAARDLTGLCLFDDVRATYVRPARGSRHLARVIKLLVDAAALPAARADASVTSLLQPAYAFAREVYPELMRPAVNHIPFWLPWLRPQPAYTLRKPTWADRLNAWLPALLWVYGWACTALVAFAANRLANYLFPRWRQVRDPDVVRFFTAVIIGLVLALGFALTRVPAHFFAGRRRAYRMRKQLAALLSARYGAAPGGLALLTEDDESFVLQLQRFLGEHHVPYEPSGDARGQSGRAAAKKIDVLADALLRAVGEGRDNELFVLMADVLGTPDEIDPLLRAVRVAVARHHRVLVICPWPPDAPPPAAEPTAPGLGPRGTATGGARESAAARPPDADTASPPTDRLHADYQRLRRTFAGMGVGVVCAQTGDPARLVLERLDRLRMVGRPR